MKNLILIICLFFSLNILSQDLLDSDLSNQDFFYDLITQPSIKEIEWKYKDLDLGDISDFQMLDEFYVYITEKGNTILLNENNFQTKLIVYIEEDNFLTQPYKLILELHE